MKITGGVDLYNNSKSFDPGRIISGADEDFKEVQGKVLEYRKKDIGKILKSMRKSDIFWQGLVSNP